MYLFIYVFIYLFIHLNVFIYLCIYLFILLIGWLTLGPNLSSSNYHKESYLANFNEESGGPLLKYDETIEALRPKTPPPKGRGIGRGGIGVNPGMGGVGRGRGYT